MGFAKYTVRFIIVLLFAIGMVALMKVFPPTIIIAVLGAMLAGCIFDEIDREISKKKSNDI